MCFYCGCTPQANYVTDTDQERLAGAVVSVPDDDTHPADGRPASVDPTEQASWGWGLDPARASGPIDQALTDLPANPIGFSVRQQDAARRDVAPEVGDYMQYEPAPYAGC